MRFVPSRDFRVRPGQVWRDLKREGELVVTSNGQPVALMVPVNGENLEEKLKVIRAAELQETVRKIQAESARKGTDKLTMAEIDEVIRRARRERRR